MLAVLITEPIAQTGVQKLLKLGYKVQTEYGTPEPHISDEEIVAVINRLHDIDGAWMDRYPNLKIIAYHGVGYDSIDLEAARARQICVATTPGQNAQAVAEHTMALLMALSKKIVPAALGYRQRGFGSKYEFSYTELKGKTLGLLGVGSIGSLVAQMAGLGFGMRVIAYDPYCPKAPQGVALLADRKQVFEQADYISLHLSLNDKTKHSVGKEEFQAMKPTACLLNTSRGAIVDEGALIEALRTGSIGGAGLDVTDPEECARDNPLLQMENVVLTPHIAGSTQEALDRVAEMCVENIDHYLKGEEIPGKRIV